MMLSAGPLFSAVMPRFTEQVEAAVEALSSDPAQPMDENEFIDASRLVYDGIRDIRKAVLMIRVRNGISDVLIACSYHLLTLRTMHHSVQQQMHWQYIKTMNLKAVRMRYI